MHPKLHQTIEQATDDRINQFRHKTEPELQRLFSKANLSYPPQQIALLAFKQERYLELWAKITEEWQFVHRYPLTAYCGKLGPKLKENDLQIPEGIYKLVSFNPYSSMHLSMMVDYPNQFDKRKAALDGRKKLGNNIFLHGSNTSVGCLAIGNSAIEQLFLLVRRIGLQQVKLVIAPCDLRKTKVKRPVLKEPSWLPELYHQISTQLAHYPLPKHELNPKAPSKPLVLVNNKH